MGKYSFLYRPFIGFIMFIAGCQIMSADNPLYLYGRVQESTFKTDLPNAWVWTIGENGERVDSIPLGYLLNMRMYEGNAEFSVPVSRNDSTYVFEAGCDGYITQTVVYKVENVKREFRRDMPIIYLERAPHKLGEVTVTASKIKFYNRGDTLVYNADAFQLAEGSMLDALINQLPGASLDNNGRITVNGEFVETLLLDGKPFFDGNNNLMLQNIGAYMVKNVEVYRGQTDLEKWMNLPEAPRHLTMNVKLKKEYNMGWIVNAQGGYGTEDRYLGRLFASWFTPRTRISLVGNMNNLNDMRTPGQSDNWTPEQMPSGTRRYQLLGLNYSHDNNDNSKGVSGNATYEGDRLDTYTATTRTNFFTDRNTYDYAYSTGRNKNIKLNTRHSGHYSTKLVSLNGDVSGSYSNIDRKSASTSASFNREQAGMTSQALQAIYSDGSAGSLESIINRAVTRSDGSSKRGDVRFMGNSLFKTSGGDMLRAAVEIKYSTQKERLWDDYNIRYGYDMATGQPGSETKRRNFIDNTPNHDLTMSGTASYMRSFGKIRATFAYEYEFHNRVKDSYAYALDRLADMGVYGSLPAGYISALDSDNSFTSDLWENTHTIRPSLQYLSSMNISNGFIVSFNPIIGIRNSRMCYYSGGRSYPVSRSSLVIMSADMMPTFSIQYSVNRKKEKGYSYSLSYSYHLDTSDPELLYMADVVNTSNPLNIDLGNPDLKNAFQHKHLISWRFNRAYINNNLRFGATHTSNALVRGYAYDLNTGVRYNKTYNVDGNYTLDATNTFSLQFGRRKEFTLSSTTEAGLVHSVDMVGTIDGTTTLDPAPSKVNTRTLAEGLKMSWQIGKQTLSFNGKVTDRRTSSTREEFADINATHYTYGLLGQFALPGGFGIGTDFTFYTRRGYGVRELDTTDAVWNARLTYTPRGGRWVFAVDGFDLLHRLSNVSYAVTATGRTVTYTNTLPRYVLATVQYRFNIKPKRK